MTDDPHNAFDKMRHPSLIDEAVHQAISLGLQLEIEYGILVGPRIVEVHCIGVNRSGSPAFRAYQVDGPSLSQDEPRWRMFLFHEVFSAKLIPIASEAPRPGYKMGDKGFASIEDQIMIDGPPMTGAHPVLKVIDDMLKPKG